MSAHVDVWFVCSPLSPLHHSTLTEGYIYTQIPLDEHFPHAIGNLNSPLVRVQIDE